MMKWGAQQAEQLVQVTFQCWKEDIQLSKEQSALDAMNAKMAELAAKGDATLQKTMLKWGAQQAEQLVSITFQSWKEDVNEEKMAKKLEAMNAQNDQATQRIMMKFA